MATSPEAGIISLLNSLIRLHGHLRLYSENNSTLDVSSAKLFDLLDKLFETVDPITIFVARHAFIYKDALIDRTNKNFELFANRLFQHGIASLTLHKGVLPPAIHGFLAMISRKPSETWDEGGMENSLRLRNISLLEVREMAEQDIRMDGIAVEEEAGRHTRKSALWERLAMSIVHGDQFPVEGVFLVQDLSPSSLAELTNQNFQETKEEARNTLARELSRFLLSLKHEKIPLYRLDAIRHLTEYVNSLSPEIRNLFLNNAFNLNLDSDLSEGFVAGLSDQIILDALQNVSAGKNYTPPVIMKLLGRLAEERGLLDKDALNSIIENKANATLLKTLFKTDDFDNYVPKQYQNALLNIIKSDNLPSRVTEHLEKLKETLEQSSMDLHVSNILLEVLRGSSDLINTNAIRSTLISTLEDLLNSRNYAKINELYRLCANDRIGEVTRSEMSHYFSSEVFTSAVIKDLKSVDKETSVEICELIFCLGSFFVEPLLERLGEEPNRSARRTYLAALSRLDEECKVKAIARLADSRWFVTRNMLYLLREFDDPALLPYIRRYIEHPHPKVQHEALKSCLLFRDVKAIPALLKALEAKEDTALISAINLAGISDNPQISAKLISVLKGGSLLNFHLDIKRAVVRALVVANRHLALPVFKEILDTTSILHPHLHDSLKIEIIAVLDNFPSEVACHLLREQVKNGTPEVAGAAQTAFVRITGTRIHE